MSLSYGFSALYIEHFLLVQINYFSLYSHDMHWVSKMNNLRHKQAIKQKRAEKIKLKEKYSNCCKKKSISSNLIRNAKVLLAHMLLKQHWTQITEFGNHFKSICHEFPSIFVQQYVIGRKS